MNNLGVELILGVSYCTLGAYGYFMIIDQILRFWLTCAHILYRRMYMKRWHIRIYNWGSIDHNRGICTHNFLVSTILDFQVVLRWKDKYQIKNQIQNYTHSQDTRTEYKCRQNKPDN